MQALPSSSDPHAPNRYAPDRSPPDLDALRARQPWAVERWIYPKKPLIRHTLARYGVADRQIDELTQEVFYQALRSLSAFRGEAKLSTWLYSIARNVACSFRKQADRSATWRPHHVSYALSTRAANAATASRSSAWGGSDPVPPPAAGPWPRPMPTPHAVTAQRERKALVRKALEALPAHYAQVIRLRDLEELSTRETAHKLGLTEVNTRVRLHRARRALRALLAPYLQSEPGR